MVSITLVSYVNSLPFLYGLKKYEPLQNNIDLLIDYPSKCTENLILGKADIGLVPVGSLSKFENYRIISDYCIGTRKEVASVLLISDVPIEQVERIYLDYQSETSNRLVKILAKEYWKIKPKWIVSDIGYENKIEGSTAGLIIGDRAFYYKEKHKYSYDLAYFWNKHTGLPFVFAVWIGRADIDQNFINKFNKALEFGVNSISQTIEYFQYQIFNRINGFSFFEYLTKYIDYQYDMDKRKATEVFLQKIFSL